MLFFAFDHPHDRPANELVELLGGKGAGLATMAGELGLPVPPGFTLTTGACVEYLEHGWTEALEDAVGLGVATIEAATGRCLGDERQPLLLSVRSGARISMPGMLDSVLNVGLSNRMGRVLGSEDAAFASDCRKRLESSYASSVGSPPPEDPRVQLREAIRAVFGSVRSPRVSAYRRREGLADDPLTAVSVQAMVFGNRDERSATGVLFTRDPASGEPRLYGDVLFRAQGEDVVSGRRRTQPIDALASRLPEAASELADMASRLERRMRDLCEIEFTIESGRLWLLQVRVGKRSARAALRIARDLALDPSFPVDRREAVQRVAELLSEPGRLQAEVGAAQATSHPPLACGVGASPGVASGELVVDVESALRRAEAGRRVILVRPETSPADVEGMQAACGLLTARGGIASHAAVIARSWNIPAVVGLEGLVIDADGIELAGQRFRLGELLSLDGTTGFVYRGRLPTRAIALPEAEELRDWAHDLAIEIAPSSTPRPEPQLASQAESRSATGITVRAADPSSQPAPLDHAIVRSLSIKGATPLDLLAAALGAPTEALADGIAALEAAGLVAPARPIGIGLTEAGRVRAAELLEEDQATLGVDPAREALDAFQTLDGRLKQTVTDWQLRLLEDERVPNDHADADWDASVLARLVAIGQEALPLIAALAGGLPRIQRYAERLSTALERIAAGDGRFVASPRVDSVHGVWFELHEELIRLAGRTRAQELAEGRAG